MAAPRSVQFIALRNLSRGTHQVRNLHMTGPATYASTVLTKERPGSNLPHDIAGLRSECKRRKIDFSGNKQDLISRLSADEITSSRAFSTAVEQSKRPTQPKTEYTSNTVRHFNTSRTLKTVNDSSTIDFAYLPDFDPDNSEASSTLMMRVPITPDNFSPARTGAHAPEVEEIVVMKPEIVSASPFSIVLPVADSHDGHANGIDFHTTMTDFMMTTVAKPVEKQVGVMREVWNSMLDDVLGAKGGQKPASA